MSTNGDKTRKIALIKQWFASSHFERSPSEIDRVVDGIDWQAEVDNSLSASANWELIKDRHDLRTKGEFDELVAAMDSAAEDQIRREIEQQFDEFGVEPVVDAIAGNPLDLPTDQRRELQQRVDDVLEEVAPDAYDAVLQDRVGELFEVLGGDIRTVSASRLKRLQEQAREGPTEEKRQEAVDDVLNALEREFGIRFDSIDDAVLRLRQRIAQARGERLEVASIQARGLEDEVRIRIRDGAEFEQYRDEVESRARQLLDLSDVPSPGTVTIGEIRIRGGDLESINLERGFERLGAAAEATEEELEEASGGQGEPGSVAADELEGEDLVEYAVDVAERELSVDDVLDQFDRDDLTRMQDWIEENREADVVDDLADALQDFPDDQLGAAVEPPATPGESNPFLDLMALLPMEVPPPPPPTFDREEDVSVEEVDEPEEEATDEDVEDALEDVGAGRGGAGQPSDIFDAVEDAVENALGGLFDQDVQIGDGETRFQDDGRLDPFQPMPERKAVDEYFSGDPRAEEKAEAWVLAEQDRLDEAELSGVVRSPQDYWREVGARLWGNILTRQEFVNPETAGR